jgi:hypothetical protein
MAIVDFSVIPRQLAPEMSANEAIRFLIYLINNLPSNIGVGSATAANQDTEITSLATLHTDNTTLGTLISGILKTQRPDLGTPATPSILTSTGDIIAANASRKYFYVQNLSINPLFVRLGTGASATVFHKVLKASTVATDGSGGDFVEDQFRGIVSIFGTSPSYIAWETT